MLPALHDLIGRMAARPSTTDSWAAYREAELLSDSSMLEELRPLFSDPSRSVRAAAYFAVGWIGANCGSTAAAVFLMGRLPSELDKYALSSLLGALTRAPKSEALDITPVLNLLKDKRWLVRHAAIQALKGAHSTQAEDGLLELMEKTSDPHDLCYCHSTLNAMGTPKSLPALTANLKSKKRDVKLSAELAIAAIRGRTAA